MPAAYLPVDHEEVVSAPHELPPPLDAGGAIEHQALSVEVPASVDDIEDLPSLLWFPDDHLAIVQNGHSSSNHNFLDIVVSSAPNPLASSEESVYEDALTGEAEPDVPESVPLALGAGQLARYDSGAGSTFVDPIGDVSVPPENAVYPEDSGLAPVEQLVHIAVPHAIPGAPIAEPEDVEVAVFDPLDASPLLASLGFSRVQQAYESWLVNMSHSISLFQGMSSQDYMMTHLHFSGFRATVIYYEWPMGNLDRVGRRFVRTLRQTMTAYQQVRLNPYSDDTWNVLRVRTPCFQILYSLFYFQEKLSRCTTAFDRLEAEMDDIYEANVPMDLRLLRQE